MRHFGKAALMLGGLGLTFAATPALAGGCGYGAGLQNCDSGTVVNVNGAPSFGPMTVNIEQPMGHLRTVEYTRSPNVSITRVHGMGPSASLADAPSGFTGGCHPTSTTYCRSDAGTPVNVQLNTPQIAAPFVPQFQAPVMATPQYRAPMVSAPLPAPRIIAIGGGYDPSKFAPRVYGDNTITPGIVHAPTSFIDRDPTRAAAALSRSGVSYGSQSYSSQSYGSQFGGGQSYSSQSFGSMTLNAAPQGAGLGGRQIGSVVNYVQTQAASPAPANAMGGVDASGGYWEKVSGVTRFGDTIATQVICRRQAPQPTVQRIVRPVIGVPTPVPTPVPYTVNVPAHCAPGFVPQQRGHNARYGSQKAPHVPISRHLTNGRWTY
ncbi:hypothetical protein [Fretibacter rubidus]|uniref:hypothetical protein n=1 Tax=Fretibacter rubidus TaxID=570162 RepID=UPI00352A0C0E